MRWKRPALNFEAAKVQEPRPRESPITQTADPFARTVTDPVGVRPNSPETETDRRSAPSPPTVTRECDSLRAVAVEARVTAARTMTQILIQLATLDNLSVIKGNP